MREAGDKNEVRLALFSLAFVTSRTAIQKPQIGTMAATELPRVPGDVYESSR